MLTFSTKNAKLFVLAVLALSVAGFSLSSRERSAHAQVDDTLTKIAQYRTWKRITKEPIRGATLDSLLSATVDAEAIGGGWVTGSSIPSLGSDPDLISVFKKAGKGVGSIFASKEKTGPKESASPAAEVSDHGFSYGVVYANEIAGLEMNRPFRKFAIGSMIVRERLDSFTATSPTAVIAMVKRESGFSKSTDDWEFLSFNGSGLKLLSRQTAGNCAECHTKARDSDWVFIDRLKAQ